MNTNILILALAIAACMAPAMARPGRGILQSDRTATTVPDPVNPPVVNYTMNGTTDSNLVTCRGEPICLGQVCNPDAYKYDLATDGDEVPFAVSYTTTKTLTETTFVFMVCSKNIGCTADSTDPQCSPLKSFQLRMHDYQIDSGAIIRATPQGTNWASCAPQGPGYLWDTYSLGNLTTSAPGTPDTCQRLSVAVTADDSAPASLATLCQQNVTIVDNKGNTVFDGTKVQTGCFFTLETSIGRTAFGTFTEDDPKANDGATGLNLAADNSGPQPYGPGNRRRRLRAHKAVRPRRLF